MDLQSRQGFFAFFETPVPGGEPRRSLGVNLEDFAMISQLFNAENTKKQTTKLPIILVMEEILHHLGYI